MTKQPEITRLLLLAGAQTGLEDRNGNTALHLACEENDIDSVKTLLCPIYEQNCHKFKYTPQIDSPRNYINKINYEGELYVIFSMYTHLVEIKNCAIQDLLCIDKV